MENSLEEIKKELIRWIENNSDRKILLKVLEVKNETSFLIPDIKAEELSEKNFDEQFAAGMSSDELMENIAAHLETFPENNDIK